MKKKDMKKDRDPIIVYIYTCMFIIKYEIIRWLHDRKIHEPEEEVYIMLLFVLYHEH